MFTAIRFAKMDFYFGRNLDYDFLQGTNIRPLQKLPAFIFNSKIYSFARMTSLTRFPGSCSYLRCSRVKLPCPRVIWRS